jgi:hypothetical protein
MNSTILTIPTAGNRHNTVAAANKLQIKSASGQLLSLVGFNYGPDQFIQLHETEAAPAANAVPIFVFFVPSNQPYSFDTPFKFTGGLFVVNSTVRDTYTAGAADNWFLATEI